MPQLSDPVLSAVLSNLAKAADKMQDYDDAARFEKLSGKFWTGVSGSGDLENLKSVAEADLAEGYPAVTAAATDDSGAQRCVKWGEKVTSIQKSLVNRYSSKGEDLFDGKGLFICEACGFIALGSEAPEICPVCKAPRARFSKVK